MSPPYGSLPPEGYETQPEKDAREMLERLTDELEPREPAVDVRISISKGNPAKVLIDMSQGADLIVVGSRGHGGLRRHAPWLGEPTRRGTRSLPSGRPALIPPAAGKTGLLARIGPRTPLTRSGQGRPDAPGQSLENLCVSDGIAYDQTLPSRLADKSSRPSLISKSWSRPGRRARHHADR